MSGATYRIEVFRAIEPSDTYPWKAWVRRLSDDEMVAAGVGTTPHEAADMARDLVKRMNESPPPYTLYVDDEGRDADAPHSVKVP